MRLSDVLKIPFTKVDHWHFIYMIVLMVSIVPGTLLWFFSFGSFRYFHLMDLWCDYTINMSLKNERK